MSFIVEASREPRHYQCSECLPRRVLEDLASLRPCPRSRTTPSEAFLRSFRDVVFGPRRNYEASVAAQLFGERAREDAEHGSNFVCTPMGGHPNVGQHDWIALDGALGVSDAVARSLADALALACLYAALCAVDATLNTSLQLRSTDESLHISASTRRMTASFVSRTTVFEPIASSNSSRSSNRRCDLSFRGHASSLAGGSPEFLRYFLDMASRARFRRVSKSDTEEGGAEETILEESSSRIELLRVTFWKRSSGKRARSPEFGARCHDARRRAGDCQSARR